MKNRNIPFGYQFQNGTVIINEPERETLKIIFECYQNNLSLLKIAERLNSEQREYMPSVIGWNKARLMRIIEDERYTGNDQYPAIINEETYVNCKRLKSDRNTQRLTDRNEDIYKLNLPILCPNCGHELHRRHDPRCKCKQRWFCSNDDCRLLTEIPDTELLQAITDVMNEIIANPGIITETQIAESEPNNDVRRIENEIAQTLDSIGFNKETLREKMLECVSIKYRSIDSKNIITKMLKADFEKLGSLSTFFRRAMFTDGQRSHIATR